MTNDFDMALATHLNERFQPELEQTCTICSASDADKEVKFREFGIETRQSGLWGYALCLTCEEQDNHPVDCFICGSFHEPKRKMTKIKYDVRDELVCSCCAGKLGKVPFKRGQVKFDE
jgi:hypothetical protein